MEISRRSFFKSLVTSTGCAVLLPQEMEANVALSPGKEPWMHDWLAAPRIPILNSTEPIERFFIRALRLNQPAQIHCSLRSRSVPVAPCVDDAFSVQAILPFALQRLFKRTTRCRCQRLGGNIGLGGPVEQRAEAEHLRRRA